MAASPDFLDDLRFNRIFTLPADPANGRAVPFQVKYADYGYRNEEHPEQESVLLFYSPMLASRLYQITKDDLAKRHKIRIINADRPGIGGTDPVDVRDEVQLWTETTLALLRHLGIPHVSVACHSGGTIYALDMLLHHPEILHPDRPYFAIGAPWILPQHSSATLMSVTQMLPAALIGKVDKLAQFLQGPVGSTFGVVFGASQAFVSKAASTLPFGSSDEQDALDENAMASAAEEELGPLLLKRIYSEGIQGLPSEALLFMKKVESANGMNGWGDWGDYDVLVPRLVESLRTSGRKMTVRVYFAETDIMIGDADTKGPRWMDQCWNTDQCGETVDYQSTVVKEADHDWIWSLKYRAIREVFEAIGQPPEGNV